MKLISCIAILGFAGLCPSQYGAVATGENPIVKEALKHLGTPYKWGGNDLKKGVDTSHFVSLVFKNAGVKCPSPPVINQENHGTLVHMNPDRKQVILNGKIVKPDKSIASYDRLKPGDRLIYQWRLDNSRGSRHTAIYIGNYNGQKHMIVHAISKGVSVTPMWKKGYAYARRD